MSIQSQIEYNNLKQNKFVWNVTSRTWEHIPYVQSWRHVYDPKKNVEVLKLIQILKWRKKIMNMTFPIQLEGDKHVLMPSARKRNERVLKENMII